MSAGVTAESDEIQERPCPACGYDLWATVDARCPECGTTYDAAASEVSRIPWLARERLGFARAVMGTWWLSFRRPGSMFAETVRPTDDLEARRFQRAVTWAPALLVGATVAWTIRSGLPGGIREEMVLNWQSQPAELEIALPMVIGPLWAKVGATLALLAALMPMASTVPFVMLRRDGRLPERAARAAALTRYGAGGVGLVAVGVTATVACSAIYGSTTGRGLTPMALQAGIAAGALMAMMGAWAMAGTPVRLMWRCGAGLPRTLAGAALLAATYAVQLATAVMLGLWLPGYLVMAYRAWAWR